MKDITDEARALAVRWVEGYEPMGSINMEQKHKLASDIMNYAANHAFEFVRFIEEDTEIIKEGGMTLYRYSRSGTEYGNYILEDIYTEFIAP